MTDVQLKDGTRLSEPEQRNDGVMTDVGLIPWGDVEGFWSFHKATKRWMFIPID